MLIIVFMLISYALFAVRPIRPLRSLRSIRPMSSIRRMRSIRSIKPMSSFAPMSSIRPMSSFTPMSSIRPMSSLRPPGSGNQAPGTGAPGTRHSDLFGKPRRKVDLKSMLKVIGLFSLQLTFQPGTGAGGGNRRHTSPHSLTEPAGPLQR